LDYPCHCANACSTLTLAQRFVEFEIDINPPSLVTRIMSVREQIAGEWTHDLETIRIANEQILESYYSKLAENRQREEECKLSPSSEASVGDDKCQTEEHDTAHDNDLFAQISKVLEEEVEEEDIDEDEEEDVELTNVEAVATDVSDSAKKELEDSNVVTGDQVLSPLEQEAVRSSEGLAASSSSSSAATTPANMNKNAVYDRGIASTMLANTMGSGEFASSPHRRGNFDLLILLATQESIHRILRQYQDAGAERRVSFFWLRQFYTSRVRDYFDNDQPYGRADDFLQVSSLLVTSTSGLTHTLTKNDHASFKALMTTPPYMKMDEKSNKSIDLVDPLRIAEDIITMRSTVATEWREVSFQIPEEHLSVRRELLVQQMQNSNPANPDPFAEWRQTELKKAEQEKEPVNAGTTAAPTATSATIETDTATASTTSTAAETVVEPSSSTPVVPGKASSSASTPSGADAKIAVDQAENRPGGIIHEEGGFE
jgi:hypothetical protein